jgi:hypothetical protein
VLADAAVWIWNIIEDRFVSCLKGLDLYHGSTHLWAIAHELFPEEAQARAWVEPLLHQLKHGQEAEVLTTLEALPAPRQAAGLSLSNPRASHAALRRKKTSKYSVTFLRR